MAQVGEITEVRVLTLCLALLPQLAAVMALAIMRVNKLVVLVVQAVAAVQIKPMLVARVIRQAHHQVRVIMEAHLLVAVVPMAAVVVAVQVQSALLELLVLVVLVAQEQHLHWLEIL
jgi:hypothetical protein